MSILTIVWIIVTFFLFIGYLRGASYIFKDINYAGIEPYIAVPIVLLWPVLVALAIIIILLFALVVVSKFLWDLLVVDTMVGIRDLFIAIFKKQSNDIRR